MLATCPTETDPMPVLAVQPLDRGRTAVFAGDTTRQVAAGVPGARPGVAVPAVLGANGPLARRRGAAVETQASIEASTDKAYYEPGEPIHISAVVRDKEGQGASDAKVVASVRGPAGQSEQVTLTAVAGPGGHYGGAIEPPIGRRQEVVVEARVGELSLASDKSAGSRPPKPGVREARSR